VLICIPYGKKGERIGKEGGEEEEEESIEIVFFQLLGKVGSNS
jgi:hypothetical protein